MYDNALTHEGIAYYFSEEKKTLDEAQAFCKGKHTYGRLVEILTREEMSFLMAIANQKYKGQNDFFIGENNSLHPEDLQFDSDSMYREDEQLPLDRDRFANQLKCPLLEGERTEG